MTPDEARRIGNHLAHHAPADLELGPDELVVLEVDNVYALIDAAAVVVARWASLSPVWRVPGIDDVVRDLAVAVLDRGRSLYPVGAQARARGRAEPKEPKEPRDARLNTCSICNGLTWVDFDEDTRRWQARCVCVARSANASRRH